MSDREQIDMVDVGPLAAELLQVRQRTTAPDDPAAARLSARGNRKRNAVQLPLNEIEGFAQAVAAVLERYKEDALQKYDWKIDEDVLTYAERELGITVFGHSLLDKTTHLRRHISTDAHRNWKQRDRLVLLADFVVRRWGGLDGNAEKTIEQYVSRFCEIECHPKDVDGYAKLFASAKQQRTLWQFNNIASWSKWLNFVWPKWALIYDARIAFGLNAIHFLRGLETPVFPQPPGRNSLLGNLDAQALAALRRGAIRQQTPPNDAKKAAKWFQQQQFRAPHAYPVYLEVMSRAHELLWADSETKPPLVHTEMLLFHVSANQLALEFASVVMKALANGPRP